MLSIVCAVRSHVRVYITALPRAHTLLSSIVASTLYSNHYLPLPCLSLHSKVVSAISLHPFARSFPPPVYPRVKLHWHSLHTRIPLFLHLQRALQRCRKAQDTQRISDNPDSFISCFLAVLSIQLIILLHAASSHPRLLFPFPFCLCFCTLSPRLLSFPSFRFSLFRLCTFS